jgi:hypothetical protein
MFSVDVGISSTLTLITLFSSFSASGDPGSSGRPMCCEDVPVHVGLVDGGEADGAGVEAGEREKE